MYRKICAFSGHRPSKFPWKYDETDMRCVKLKAALAERIASLVDRDGVTDILVGGAEGADTWAALTVLSLREKNSALRLHCILPCQGQSDSWSASARERYQGILNRADSVFYMQREYSEGCTLERNRFMVDHADMLLAVYNGEWRGGTAATVRYATKSGKRIQIINPVVQSWQEMGSGAFTETLRRSPRHFSAIS